MLPYSMRWLTKGFSLKTVSSTTIRRPCPSKRGQVIAQGLWQQPDWAERGACPSHVHSAANVSVAGCGPFAKKEC